MKKILSALLIIGLLVSHLTAFQVNASEVNIDQNLEYDKLQQGNYESTISGQIVKSDPEIVKNSDIPSLYVAADSEKPVIDTSSIWVDNTSVYYGDTVTIRVKVTDNVGVEKVYINFWSDTVSNSITEEMLYNEEIKLYEYSLYIDKEIPAGVWKIGNIYATDATGNSSNILINDIMFTIISENSDYENPVIDGNSFSKDKNIVQTNESIKFKIKVKDNSGVKSVLIGLYNESSSYDLTNYMTYNSYNNYYEYELHIDDTIPEGNWSISYIYAVDVVGNSSRYYFNNKEDVFTVINPGVDSEAPYIDTSSIKINNQTPVTNDFVNIKIKVTDNVCVDTVNGVLNNLDTNQTIFFYMSYNSKLDLYEYSFKVDDTITVGHWFFNIRAEDSIGNFNLQSFDRSNYLIIITDQGEDIHDWDEGIITKKPTSTEEGIKTYTCKFWACGATKTESIPANSETDAIGDNANNSGSNNTENGNSNENINNSNNDILSLPSWWQPTTQEEKIRYSCFGKEKLEYTTPDNQPFNINIQNAMQGEKCFEVFQNIAGDYTIARTYNIYPIGTQLQYSTPDEITVSLTIPEILRQKNREFKMICVSQNGIPFIFEDKDKDPDTITFSTDKFYAFALVYKDKN